MKIGIIGGSGLYALEGIQDVEEISLSTPYGAPSARYVSGRFNDREVVFLARHGEGHRLIPSEIPFRANIWGFKSLGITHLIAVSAVGSLQAHIAPGHIVIPDQFIDRTYLRESTFFGDGMVGHIQFGDPICPRLIEVLSASAQKVGARHHVGGTYICIEGPAFSTRAESNLYRGWGGSVIGMTNLQEAKLAREAEMCFATIALATDYDCWHESEEEVNIESVIKVMQDNIVTSKKILAEAVKTIDADRSCRCVNAMGDALLTPLESIPESTREVMRPLIGRYLPKS